VINIYVTFYNEKRIFAIEQRILYIYLINKREGVVFLLDTKRKV